ncbi:hypothetical protein ACTXT7_006217 [Hymenolepis weldensis]
MLSQCWTNLSNTFFFSFQCTPTMQQSQSITPSQLTQVTQGSAQVAFKPGVPGADIQPDLSHLTPEERRIIEDVINRQRQEELIDRELNINHNVKISCNTGESDR